jgi:hypothetical protein
MTGALLKLAGLAAVGLTGVACWRQWTYRFCASCDRYHSPSYDC